MYITDVAAHARIPNLNTDSKPIKGGVSPTIQLNIDPMMNPAATGLILEISVEAQDALRRFTPLQTSALTSADMSGETKDALRKFVAFNLPQSDSSSVESDKTSAGATDNFKPSITNSLSLLEQAEKDKIPKNIIEAYNFAIEKEAEKTRRVAGSDPLEAEEATKAETERSGAVEKTNRGLSAEEQRVINELRRRDVAVKAHETAHAIAGGGLTSSPSYTYQLGPDGRQYAIGGHVSVDTSPGRTPEETVNKARQIRTAALSPAEPSASDRAVANQATQMEMQARTQIAVEKREANEQASEEGEVEQVQVEKFDAADDVEQSTLEKEVEKMEVAKKKKEEEEKELAKEKEAEEAKKRQDLLKMQEKSSMTAQEKIEQIMPSIDTPAADPAFLKNIPDFDKPRVFPNISNIEPLTKGLTTSTGGSTALANVDGGQDLFKTTGESTSVSISEEVERRKGFTLVSDVSGTNVILTPTKPVISTAANAVLQGEAPPVPAVNAYVNVLDS